MNTHTELRRWLERHHKARQWLWFAVLWLSGLLAVSALAYPIKLLMNAG